MNLILNIVHLQHLGRQVIIMIVNKYLRQNWKKFNRISFRPINIDIPSNIKNPDEWCERVWIHLSEDDDVKRLKHYTRRKNYSINIVRDDKYLYLVQCLRSEYDTDETSIYMVECSEDNLNDFLAIAKMVHENIEDICNSSRDILKFKKAKQLEKEFNKVDGQA